MKSKIHPQKGITLMNILFIGNSYTYYNDLDVLFENLCRANGKEVHAYRITQGGRKLFQFKDENDTVTQELISSLQSRTYDVCFLQEQSLLPILNFDAFMDGLTHTVQLLKPQTPQLILYATWARKVGCPTLEEHSWTPDSMTKDLAAAYQKAGSGLDAKVSFVGLAFQKTMQLDPAIDLHDPDLSHPSYKGSCLAALTHYYTVFGSFPECAEVLSLSDHELSVFRKAVCE